MKSACNPAPHARADARRQVDLYAVAVGLFLGLCLIKFGNPVILDRKILPPANLQQAWLYAWPTHWSLWFLVPIGLAGAGLAISGKRRWPGSRWLWILPAVWFCWQFVSATRTVDVRLTTTALWQFAGCLMFYFVGALVLGNGRALRWLSVGLLAAFVFCLIRAFLQGWIEMPQEHKALLEGQRVGWTNFSPAVLSQLKRDGVIIVTNGMEMANPAILARIATRRAMGTLVYPNALAGAVLLLWPLSITLAVGGTRRFRPVTRMAVIALTLVLGLGGLFWSGSKFGWLIALGLVGIWLLRLKWPKRWKYAVVTSVTVVGMALFLVRFHHYFAAGATSVGARFDYWRAAVQVVAEKPVSGSGPGTFQRPYARLKTTGEEMARLAHNDYLEQFSDSGVVGGVAYLLWIVLALTLTGRRQWLAGQPLSFAVYLGLLGWFVQALAEFSLYIPALAWTAFTFLGWLVAVSGNQIDNPNASG